VPQLNSQDIQNLALLLRPELGVTFTKLNAWRLTQFEKCVFLDADTLVLRNVDELFERPELSAAADVGWPDCFNSGVFVFVPSETTFQNLLQHANLVGSFDGGDQGLLNSYWNDWSTSHPSRRLPFVYNLTVSTCYSYRPALNRFGRDARIVHFLGGVKPWHHTYHPTTGQVLLYPGSALTQEGIRQFLNYWWRIYITYVDPPPTVMHSQDSGYPAFDYPQVNTSSSHHVPPFSYSPIAHLVYHPTDHEESSDTWRNEWEEGRIDYMGRDSYDNIQDYMQSVLEQPPTQRPWVVDEPEETGEEEEIVVKVELIETIYQGPPKAPVLLDDETKVDSATDQVATVAPPTGEEEDIIVEVEVTETTKSPQWLLQQVKKRK
jgi:glycogenin glucosyltransferase